MAASAWPATLPRTRIALVAAMLVVSLLIPATATAEVTATRTGSAGAAPSDGVVQAPLQIALGEPFATHSDHTYAGLTIPVGVTQLTVRYGPEATRLECFLTWANSPIGIGRDQSFPRAEEAVLSVDATAVVTGGAYELRCELPDERIDTWELTAALPAAASATVSAVQPTFLVAIQEHVAYPTGEMAVSPGQGVVFHTTAGPLPVSSVYGELYDSDDILQSRGLVAADGLSVAVALPDRTSFIGYFEANRREWHGSWKVDGPAQSIDGVVVTRVHHWGGRFILVPVPSSVKVAVSSTTATSFQQVKVIVQITAPNQAGNPQQAHRGTITVRVDGVQVKSSTVYFDMNGRWTVSLPKLKRGSHVVTADYTGWSWIAGSTSNRAALRILI